MSDESLTRRLSELALRTQSLRPSAGFRARVLAAVGAEAAEAFPRELARTARWFVPLALVLAVGSLAWASRVDGPSSTAFAEAERRLELEW